MTYEYDKAGQTTGVIDWRGYRTRQAYDDLGRMTMITYPEGNIERIEYDDAGNVTARIDGEGRRVDSTYNLYNKVIETTPQDASTPFRNFYDQLGNLVKTTDMNGVSRTYEYDRLSRLTREKNVEGGTYEYSYDYSGNILTSKDPNGTTATYEYTANYQVRRLLLENDLAGKTKTLSYRYDEEGNITYVNDNGVVSTYNGFDISDSASYKPDAYGRIKNETVNVGDRTFETGYEYDMMDRITELQYPNGQEVIYSYNQMGEVTGMTNIAGTTGYLNQAPVYENGLLKKITAANGVATDYEYNKNGWMTSLRHATSSETIKSYDYTYDLAGNIKQKNQDTFKYDSQNRLIEAYLKGSFTVDVDEELQAPGAVHEDLFGKKQLNFTLEEIVEDPEILELDYNAGSIGVDLGDEYEVTKIVLTPETAENRVTPEAIRIFTSMTDFPNSYKEREWITSKYKTVDGEIVLEVVLKSPINARYVKVKTDFNELDIETFQPVNVSEFKNRADTIIKVYYNSSTRTEKYTYDNMGNRLTENVIVRRPRVNNYGYYTDGTRLKTNGRWIYRYDPNGNVIEKGDTILLDGVVTRVKDLPTSFFTALTASTQEIAFGTDNKGTHYRYEYDLLNRMTSVTKNGNTTAEYTYSWKGLRILKECPDATEGETEKTWYVYSVNGKVLYEEEEIKTTEAVENKFSQYVYIFGRHFAREDGTVDASGQVESITARYYMHTDHLGSTVAVTDQTGKTVWDNEYTPFGGLADSLDVFEGGNKYTGKDFDEDAGLYYFNARWYDQETGRFTSLDPIRDGMNWYVYCSGNPVNHTDSTGLLEDYEEDFQNYYDNLVSYWEGINGEGYLGNEAYINLYNTNIENDARKFEQHFYRAEYIIKNGKFLPNEEGKYNYLCYEFVDLEILHDFIRAREYIFESGVTEDRIREVEKEAREMGITIRVEDYWEGGGYKSVVTDPRGRIERNVRTIYWDRKGIEIMGPVNKSFIDNVWDMGGLNMTTYMLSAAMVLGHELAGHGFQDLVENKNSEYIAAKYFIEDYYKQNLPPEKRGELSDAFKAIEKFEEITMPMLEWDVVENWEKIAVSELNCKGYVEAMRNEYKDTNGPRNTPYVWSTVPGR